MNIRGKKVLLRAIEERDLPLLHEWANDPEIWDFLDSWHFPLSERDGQKWFEHLSEKSLDQRFAIETPDFGLIGTANLVNINWKDRNAFHGMMLGNKNIRGKGYGTDTIMTVMRYAFEELGLERLDGSMIEYNEASLAVYIRKCGWKEEGRQRRHYFRKNKFWDRIIVGITRQDYFQLIESNKYWDKRL
ncbi:MAG: GNAT family N-acetyltransferase [Deltaproteobacteria bacterium]|nr:GNAT family N-acetyltransferase [Deltaproteobacteria bacterium]MBW1929219.1 GNAT family N-acetyltransferase [Deltaproteobacteria bacterium]MBW2025240.1 GNAT family N-acetyltransferase [Deltaproteobacteria bacterium]